MTQEDYKRKLQNLPVDRPKVKGGEGTITSSPEGNFSLKEGLVGTDGNLFDAYLKAGGKMYTPLGEGKASVKYPIKSYMQGNYDSNMSDAIVSAEIANGGLSIGGTQFAGDPKSLMLNTKLQGKPGSVSATYRPESNETRVDAALNLTDNLYVNGTVKNEEPSMVGLGYRKGNFSTNVQYDTKRDRVNARLAYRW